MSDDIVEVLPPLSSKLSLTVPLSSQRGIPTTNASTEYLKTLGSEVSRQVVKNRLDRVARWFNYADAEHCDWHLIRYHHIVDFIDHLKNSENHGRNRRDVHALRTSTINCYLKAIKSVVRVAWNLDQIDDHTLNKILAIKQVRGFDIPQGRAMTFAESKAILNACSGDSPQAVRDKAVVTLLLGNGLRRAEIGTIQMNDIDLDKREITIRGKGNKTRLIMMTDPVVKVLKHWIDVRENYPCGDKYQSTNTPCGDYLFCRFTRHYHELVKGKALTTRSISLIVDNVVDKASKSVSSVKDVHCHDFRRTFATRLFDSGVDINVIKNLMGHASITTTARYDKRGNDAMRNAMDLTKL